MQTKKKNKEIYILNCKRVSIIGASGSGKSTLCVKLGELLNLPVYHLDMLFWKPNWERSEKKAFLKQVKKITKLKTWIIDGTYSKTLKNRFKRSDLVIFLNFSEDFCKNSVKERFEKGKLNRVGLANYLEETKEGLEELTLGITKFYLSKLSKVIKIKDKYAKHKVLEFHTREQLNKFLSDLKIIV